MNKKKLIRIVATLLILITSIGIFSTIMVKTFVRFHDCEASKSYSYNELSHYYTCSKSRYCDNKFTITEHDLKWVVDKEETFLGNGLMHQECYCGYITNLNTVIDELTLEDDLTTSPLVNVVDSRLQSDEINTSYGYFADTSRSKATFSALYNLNAVLPGYKVSSLVYFYKAGFSIYDELGNKTEILLTLDCENYSESTLKIGDYEIKNLYNISSFVEDFYNCKYLTLDFGVYRFDNKWHYGFIFKTENCELSYFNDDTGTIQNDSAVKYTLSWIGDNGIFNNSDNNSAIDLYCNVYGKHGVVSTSLTCDKGSSMFLNKVHGLA